MTELQRSEILCIPKRRRLVHSKETGADGQALLRVFYGEKEVIFDDPELLPFGDQLLVAAHFRAEEAISWSNGAPHTWEKIRELLEALLDHEILKRVTESSDFSGAQKQCPTRLGGVVAAQEPRTFSAYRDQCSHITQEAFGRAIDLSNLEAILPVYRVAHSALDQDGRQLGENNVAPRCLFLDLPTQRRVCQYPGSRYQADVPMNVTALKHMTSRWPELLSLTEQFRRAFFARLPPRGPSLSAGEVQLLAACCLASVGYVMVRGEEPVPNGELDTGLAGMFRLVDGVRLVTTELIREEASEYRCGDTVSARGIADYAERQSVYVGMYGVCAGPQALIDEYLRVLLGEANAPIHVEPDLASRLGDLGAALDYGLLGQRIESIVRAFGAAQGLLHEQLRTAFKPDHPRSKLHELVAAPIDSEHYPLLRSNHPLPEMFNLEISVSRWMFTQAAAGLPRDQIATYETIDDLLAPDHTSEVVSQRLLVEFFRRALPDRASFAESFLDELAAIAARVFSLERRCLRAVAGEQRRLNARLHRQPGRALTARDLAVYNRPRTGPPLELTLAEGLDLEITTDATSTLLRHGEHQLILCD